MWEWGAASVDGCVVQIKGKKFTNAGMEVRAVFGGADIMCVCDAGRLLT